MRNSDSPRLVAPWRSSALVPAVLVDTMERVALQEGNITVELEESLGARALPDRVPLAAG